MLDHYGRPLSIKFCNNNAAKEVIPRYKDDLALKRADAIKAIAMLQNYLRMSASINIDDYNVRNLMYKVQRLKEEVDK